MRWRLTILIWFLVIVYISFLFMFMSIIGSSDASARNGKGGGAQPPPPRRTTTTTFPRSYAEWRKLAVDLARLAPAEVLATLERDDPFGVRGVAKMMEEKTAQEDSPDLADIEKLFPCPPQDQRLSFPDQRNQDRARGFRERDETGTFVWLQHLRKAGGTNFCTLATANLRHEELPPYYCMPDYQWHHDDNNGRQERRACAGCLHHWTNEEIIRKIKPHRIAGNEWDSFDPSRHLDLPAVYVTSFRRPLARAVSQFRFECLEERGCKFKEIEPWWEHRRDLYNVYTWTFSDVGRQGHLFDSTHAGDIAKRAGAVGLALDVVMQFHVVLSMEYLRFGAPLVEHVLGFEDTSVLTTHVRPHNGQIKRKDSLIPKEFLSPDQYKLMSESLALDEILTDAAQRLFWERLVCKTY